MATLPFQNEPFIREAKANPKAPFKTALVRENEFTSYPEEIRNQFVYDDDTDTYFLPDDVWVNWRAHGEYWQDESHPQYLRATIGGSDSSAIVDGTKFTEYLLKHHPEMAGQKVNPYTSRAEVYYDKIGKDLEVDMAPTSPEVFYTGHVEEESIRQYFKHNWENSHDAKIRVENDTRFYHSTLIKGLVCNVDGTVTLHDDRFGDIKGVLECKTCNWRSKDYPLWMANIVPLHYYIQCMTYMCCLNLPFAYICVKTGLGANAVKYFFIERDREAEDLLIKALSEFLACVEEGKEPSIEGTDIDGMLRFWRRKTGVSPDSLKPAFELPKSFLPTVAKISELNKEEEELNAKIAAISEARSKLLLTEVIPLIGNSDYGTLPLEDETIILRVKKPEGRARSLDTDKIKTDMPKIFALYSKKEDKITFDSKKFKADYPDLVKEYTKAPAKLDKDDERIYYCSVERREKV